MLNWKSVIIVAMCVNLIGCANQTASKEVAVNSQQSTTKGAERKSSESAVQQKSIESKKVEQPVEKMQIKFDKEFVRIGDFDLAVGYKFDFKNYESSALTKTDLETEKPEQPIKIDWHKQAEVEVYYNDSIDVKKTEWKIKPDPKSMDSYMLWTPTQGKISSYKIDDTRAIAEFSPWVYVPYGDGGVTELQFNYVLKDGTKGSRVWKFRLDKTDSLGAFK